MGDVLKFNKAEEPEVFERTKCPACAMIFAVPEKWIDNKREDHSGFNCPNGHGLSFPTKSRADKLQDEIAALKDEINNLKAEIKRRKQRRSIFGILTGKA